MVGGSEQAGDRAGGDGWAVGEAWTVFNNKIGMHGHILS